MTIRRSDKSGSVLPVNDPAVALAKARSFCAYQERCRAEVVTRIHSFGLAREQCEQILDKLEEEGFLNDERFAEAYAGSKFRILRWGKMKIRAGLRSKGVAEELISRALDLIDEEQYMKCLADQLDVKLRALQAIDDERVIKQKIFSYLASKGFEENLIFQELNKRYIK
ncbi:MAG: regulatory protein RecX [Bacteroidota bacterium]|nr:regulatory protein RecX [Bacteroidota bacterium]